MRAKAIIMIIAGIILAFSANSLKAQTTTAHCYANVQIVDPGYMSGDYYYISIRIETKYPSVSGWSTPVGPITSLANPVQFTNVVFSSVPYPTPVSRDYFSIGAIVSKNGGTPLYYHSSIATPTVIDAYNTRFDANDNPIEVKIP